MKGLAALCLSLWLVGCAGVPPMAPAGDLFHDELFPAPSSPIDATAALRPSPAMKAWLATRLPSRMSAGDRRRQLVEALYHGDLKLEYDATTTRNAAEAFDARSGNCLALVLMTSALAHELDLRVGYQQVLGEEDYSRADDLLVGIGHVNLVLEEPREGNGFKITSSTPMVVDFLPPRQAWSLRSIPVEERTVVAMYLNNRAVESLLQGHADTAYWWSREALRVDPDWLDAYVTLGVVYRQVKRPDLAEAALRRVADRAPEHLAALSNRVLALRDLARDAEADALARRLARLDPHPPYSWFTQGMAALRDGQPALAERYFAREAQRAPGHAEFEFWIAVSRAEAGDPEGAVLHLRRALAASATRQERDLYAGKLERLKASGLQ